MKVAGLYMTLCRLYGIETPLEIEHFLVMAMEPSPCVLVGNSDISREALIIRQNGDDIEMGLYLDPAIVCALEGGEELDNLDAFSCAAEGVSHFLYVADRAGKGMKVSKLELELQGEVDKFLLIHLIAASRFDSVPREFFERQFESHSFDPSLGADEAARYRAASHFAAKFCAHLRSTCFNPLRRSDLVARAREFFSLRLAGKIAMLTP